MPLNYDIFINDNIQEVQGICAINNYFNMNYYNGKLTNLITYKTLQSIQRSFMLCKHYKFIIIFFIS